MNNSMSQILVESVVKKFLKDIKESPERGTRNLIDMALEFVDGRFQKSFFKTAQTMLENESSAYYGLVRDIVMYADSDRMLTFGMNLGYNSCTVGAQRIRENEKKMGFKIPWAMIFEINAQKLAAHTDQYRAAIDDGEKLGIYTWLLFAEDEPQAALPFVKEHSDSAFFVFCNPADITPEFIDSVLELNNLMLVVYYDEGASDVYAQLRDKGLLYSVWYRYGQEDAETILNGDLFCSAQQQSPIFTVLLPKNDCPDEIQPLVHQAVVQARVGQSYRTVLWELHGDNDMVDGIISDDVCSVYFDEDGMLHDWNRKTDEEHQNIFESSMPDILRHACPR